MGDDQSDPAEDYEPAVITATEENPIHLAFYDGRIENTEHVIMPEPDDAEEA